MEPSRTIPRLYPDHPDSPRHVRPLRPHSGMRGWRNGAPLAAARASHTGPGGSASTVHAQCTPERAPAPKQSVSERSRAPRARPERLGRRPSAQGTCMSRSTRACRRAHETIQGVRRGASRQADIQRRFALQEHGHDAHLAYRERAELVDVHHDHRQRRSGSERRSSPFSTVSCADSSTAMQFAVTFADKSRRRPQSNAVTPVPSVGVETHTPVPSSMCSSSSPTVVVSGPVGPRGVEHDGEVRVASLTRLQREEHSIQAGPWRRPSIDHQIDRAAFRRVAHQSRSRLRPAQERDCSRSRTRLLCLYERISCTRTHCGPHALNTLTARCPCRTARASCRRGRSPRRPWPTRGRGRRRRRTATRHRRPLLGLDLRRAALLVQHGAQQPARELVVEAAGLLARARDAVAVELLVLGGGVGRDGPMRLEVVREFFLYSPTPDRETIAGWSGYGPRRLHTSPGHLW